MSERKGRSWIADGFLIVISILVAFQVEEWRERRAEQRDLDAAMESLLAEMEENVARCELSLADMEANVRAVHHVYASLQAGEVLNDDLELFRKGFSVYDVLPNIGMMTTVAEEMLATGLLREVENVELRRSISRLPVFDRQMRDLLAYWRDINANLQEAVIAAVDLSFDENWSEPWNSTAGTAVAEQSTRVAFDMEALAANRALKNGFFEAVDIHADTVGVTRMLCHEVALTLRHIAADRSHSSLRTSE